MYVCEMDNLKALKHVLSNGKKRAYFEDVESKKVPEDFPVKREKSVLELINSKPKIKLTKIEVLEKRLKEGEFDQ